MPPSRGDGPDLLSVPRTLATTIDGHEAAVNVVRYNHGARYLLSGSTDRTIRLWNPAGKEIKVYRGHAHEVLAVDIANDNAKFASCGGDRAVFVWDVASGSITRRLQGHFGKLNAVGFNNDGGVLVSGGFDAKVMIWDMRAASRDPLQVLKDASSSITSLEIPTDSVEIIAGSNDGHVRSWDMRMGKVVEDCIGSPVASVALSPSRETMLVSSDKLRLFDRSNGQVLQTFSGGTPHIRSRPAFNRGEGAVIAGDSEGRLWSWGVLDAKVLSNDAIHKRAVTDVVVNPNGKEMVTCSLDGTIKVWTR